MGVATEDYLEGALFAAAVLTACALAGRAAVTRRMPRLGRVERLLAGFLVGTAVLVAAHLLPGLIGLLARWPVLGCAVVLAAAAHRLPRTAGPSGGAPADAHDPAAARALAVAGVGVAAVGAVAFLVSRSLHAVDAVDALTTHLPAVARWLQEGSFWQLPQYAPDLSNATYPHHGTLMLLAGVLPWDGTFLVRYVNVPFVLAAAVAVAAIARRLGAPWSAAALAGAAVTAMRAVNEPAFEQAQVDAPMLAWFALGALFLVRWAQGRARTDLVLAGLGLGLAFGTKWYAAVDVPIVAAVALAAVGIPLRRRVGPALGLAAIVGGTGGVWLVRNWVQTGNPLHPAPIALGPVTIFSAPPDPLRAYAGFTVADYLTAPQVLADWLIPAWWQNFGLLGPLLGIMAVAALAARRPPAARAVGAAALLMAAAYTVLPDTAFGPPGEPVLAGPNARYLVPALLAAAVAAAVLARRWPVAIAALLLAGIVEGVMRTYGAVGPGDVGRAVALVTVIAGAAWALRARPRVAAASAVLALFAAGLELNERAGLERYGEMDPAIGWVESHVPPDGRVAVGGIWSPNGLSPVLPAFGERLDRRVDYLGRFVDGTLRRHRDRAGFREQLERGRYDALILGTGIEPRPGGAEPELIWARSAGYRVVARSERLIALAR